MTIKYQFYIGKIRRLEARQREERERQKFYLIEELRERREGRQDRSVPAYREYQRQ